MPNSQKAENQGQGEASQTGDQTQEGTQQTAEQKVELDVGTYNALLDKLEELEEGSKQKTGSVQDLANEGKGAAQEKTSEQVKDLDQLSQTELAEHITRSLGENVINPLLVNVHGLRLELEIDRLSKVKGYEDFAEHQDEVFKIATENPRLSMKQAYDLHAKEREQNKGSEGQDTKKDRDALLKHLPKKVTLGERPGATGMGDKEATPDSRKSAAEKAIDELGIKF